MNDEITIITRQGFWSSDARTFKRDKVEITYPWIAPSGDNTSVGAVSCSACDPCGLPVEVETKDGEIIKGYEYQGGCYEY